MLKLQVFQKNSLSVMGFVTIGLNFHIIFTMLYMLSPSNRTENYVTIYGNNLKFPNFIF